MKGDIKDKKCWEGNFFSSFQENSCWVLQQEEWVCTIWRKKITGGRRRAVRKRNNEIKWPNMTGKSWRFHSQSDQEHLHRECSICLLKRPHSTEIILPPEEKYFLTAHIFWFNIDCFSVAKVRGESKKRLRGEASQMEELSYLIISSLIWLKLGCDSKSIGILASQT